MKQRGDAEMTDAGSQPTPDRLPFRFALSPLYSARMRVHNLSEMKPWMPLHD